MNKRQYETFQNTLLMLSKYPKTRIVNLNLTYHRENRVFGDPE